MTKNLIVAALVAASLVTASIAGANQTVPMLSARVANARVATAFSRFVADHQNSIIGLQVRIDDRLADAAGGQFVLGTDTREIVANSGFRFEHGGFVFDGFFLVKSGGMHQGVTSFGLVAVNEAAVRLSGVDVTVVTLP